MAGGAARVAVRRECGGRDVGFMELGCVEFTVDDTNPALRTLNALNYENCSLFLIMGDADLYHQP